jgi:alkaline phosphatase
MDVDFRMLVGYGANADRYEDWLTNALPINDSQQPFNNVVPLSTHPQISPTGFGSRPVRDQGGQFLVTGQVADSSAVHTASDIPLSAFGHGASLFGGTMDNTDVFFRVMQGVLGGVR